MKISFLFNVIFLQVFLIPLTDAKEARFYIGTFTGQKSSSKGIYTGTLNTETGKLSPITLATVSDNPSYIALSPDKTTLYDAEELPKMGQVKAFRVHADGSLTLLNQCPALGDACYISVDPSGQNVFVANYGAGTIVCIHLLKDGSLGPVTDQIQLTGSGPDKKRQTKPHAHYIQTSPDGTHVYACDLGTDQVWVYDLTPATGHLESHLPATASVPPGDGVRHLAFTQDGTFVYSANEMGGSASVFSRTSSGTLQRIQTLSTMASGHPEPGVTTAEIQLSPSQKFLYVSNRGCDTVTVFQVGADGKLTLKQISDAGVKVPRGFAIDPTGHWLVIGGQNDSKLAVLKINSDGSLSPTGETSSVGMPVCVLWE